MRKITYFKTMLLAVLLLVSGKSFGQVYKEDFGNSTTVAVPYTSGTNATGSVIKDANFTSPVWNQNLSSANFAGNTLGGMSATTGINAYTITCTFTVATNFQFNPTSIGFDNRGSATGPNALTITISGTGGSTSVSPTPSRTGAFTTTAPTNFASTTQNLTGLVTLTFAFTGGASGSTERFDNVILNGTVSATGNTAPSLSTPTSASISSSTATLGATITSNGGVAISESGIVYDINATPTTHATLTSPLVSTNIAFTVPVSSLTPQTLYYYRGYAINTQGTGYSSDGTFRTLSNAPTLQASNLTGTATSNTALNISWTAATFPSSDATIKGYVLLRATSPNTPSLSNSNGAAPAAGTNTTIVSSTIAEGATSQANSGLTTNTTYNYLLVPFCWDGTNASTYFYLTTSAPTTSKVTLALTPSAPTVNTATVNSLNVGITLGSNPAATEFAIYETSTSKYVQADGTLGTSAVWQNNATWGTKTVTGLSSATTYTFEIKARNLDLVETAYGSTTNGTTLAAEPTSQPTNLIFSNVTTVSMDVAFTAGSDSPNGYLVLRRAGSAPTGTPIDGTTYTAGQFNIGSGTNTVAYVGSSTGFSESSLTAGTSYYYTIYSYNTNGSTPNYYTTSPLNSNQLLFCTGPVANAATSITTISLNANWAASIGAASYRLDIATDNGFTSLVSGYNDLNVGNVVTYPVTGLTMGTAYYYRVRAVNASGTSTSSNTITTATVSNYYSKGSLTPSDLSSWSSSADGLGAPPTDFLSPSNYIIQNGHSMTTTATWSFGTSGSVLQIQDGGTLQANNAITLASGTTFQIDNGGTYIHNNTGIPSSTIFNGTENFGSSSNIRIDNWTSNTTVITTGVTLPFGNLEINWTGNTANWQQGWSGTINLCSGNLTVTSVGTGTIRFAAGTAPTINVSGNFTQTAGTVNLASTSGTSVTTLNVAGNFAVNGGTFTSTSTGSKVVLNGSSSQSFTNAGTISVANFEVSNSAGVSLASNVTLSNLTINAGAILNINAGQQLTVSTTLTNNGALNLLSSPSGTATILTPATISGSGTASVQQYLTGALNSGTGFPNGRFWYVATPVAGATSNVFNAAADANKLWYYTESAHGYTEITDNTTDLSVGTGYVARMGANTTLNFSGTGLYTGDKTISLSYNSGNTYSGFNLIGNPYPSFLDYQQVQNWQATPYTSPINPTIWVRSFSGTAMGFDTYNFSLGQGVSSNGHTVTQYIAPLQAFWVETSASSSITLTNTMRKGQDLTAPTNLLKAPAMATSQQPLVRLQVSNGTNSDESLLAFNANAADGFDAYDSHKMLANDPALPEIYSLPGTDKLAINCMNSLALDKEIALGFNTAQANTFTLKASQISNLDEGTRLFLKDKLLNTETELTPETAYSFTSDATTTTDRFSVVFKSAGSVTGINNPLNNDASVLVYTGSNNRIKINYTGDLNKNVSVSVYNAVGQKLQSKQMTTSSTEMNALSSGVYMVTVTTDGKSISKKIVLN